MDYKQEIERSRKGGFGGSDAKMFYKVGQKGIASLSNTDKKRILIALGLKEYRKVFENKAMQEGNRFENYIYTEKQEIWESNKYLECPLQPENFKIFAHADCYSAEDNTVYECKYTSSDTDKTLKSYMAQLQWYYLIGVSKVYLVKGTQGHYYGDYETVFVEKDDKFIEVLREGIKRIDLYCGDLISSGITCKDEDGLILVNNLVPENRKYVNKLYDYFNMIRKLEKKSKELEEKITEFMLDNGVKSIKSDKYSITLIPDQIRNSFDKARFFKEHPEFSEADYIKQSKVKPFIKINLKNED